jgi:acylphosphatase
MTKRVRIRLKGRVQGVGFRLAAADLARSFGLTGFVCNELDGSVLVEVEGETTALAPFVDWCRKGPPEAKVSEAIEVEMAVQGDRSFEITRPVHS